MIDFTDFHPDYVITTSQDGDTTEVVVTNKNGLSGAAERFTKEQVASGEPEAWVHNLIDERII